MKRKKSSILLLLFFSVFPLLLMGGGLFLCSRTSGFSLDKISSRFDYNRTWEIGPITEEQKEQLVQEVFPQTYYYLAAGNRCYAFISEDRKYILKFFKMQNLSSGGGVGSFPFSLLKHLGLRQGPGNPLFSERIFANYKDAYEILREETGLLYIHFNKTREFKSKVNLVDSKGKKHIVDLDAVEYIVQKRATKIFDYFEELLSQNKYDDLRISIRSFLQLIASRCHKGFVDHDVNIRDNCGFIGNMAIQFDCATLTRDSSMTYPMNFRQEVLEIAERLDFWARDNFPEMILFVQEEAQRLINQS